jgi:XTP/dITP diphosphohydrolase
LKKLVAATGNPGKLREFEQVLKPLGFDIVPQTTLGVGEADEPHATFVENALAKARHASRHAGLPAFADDSGICVAALAGAPGVHSARYAAADASPVIPREEQDRRNNDKLLSALADVADRRAHYYCVIVLVRRADDPVPLIAEGRWDGEVIDTPRGSSGFGYDPYFYVPPLARTAAELGADEKNAVSHREKNAVSHRGQALRQLVERLSHEP